MARVPTSRAAVIPTLGEAFREHGYDGASMAVLQEESGLGRGSLYNFFPGGKEEMAQAVLDDIDVWFQAHIFIPLRAAAASDAAHAHAAVANMFTELDAYFRSGRRVCLQGAFAISHERDRFARAVAGYFTEWVCALTEALESSGTKDAKSVALRSVAAIQGGIVLARALDDETAFTTVVTAAAAAAAAAAATVAVAVPVTG